MPIIDREVINVLFFSWEVWFVPRIRGGGLLWLLWLLSLQCIHKLLLVVIRGGVIPVDLRTTTTTIRHGVSHPDVGQQILEQRRQPFLPVLVAPEVSLGHEAFAVGRVRIEALQARVEEDQDHLPRWVQGQMVQDGATVGVWDGVGGAPAQQEGRGEVGGPVDGPRQRGEAEVVARVHVGACQQHQVHDLHHLCTRRPRQAPDLVGSMGLQADAPVDEKPGGFHDFVRGLRGAVFFHQVDQRVQAVLSAGVHVHVVLQQEPGCRVATDGCRPPSARSGRDSDWAHSDRRSAARVCELWWHRLEGMPTAGRCCRTNLARRCRNPPELVPGPSRRV